MNRVRKKGQIKKLIAFISLAILFSSYVEFIIYEDTGINTLQRGTDTLDNLMRTVTWSAENISMSLLEVDLKVNNEVEVNDFIFEDIIKKQKKKALEYERIGAYSKGHDIYIQIIGIDRFDEDAWNGIINSLEKRDRPEAHQMEQMMKKVFKMKN